MGVHALLMLQKKESFIHVRVRIKCQIIYSTTVSQQKCANDVGRSPFRRPA